MEQENKFNYLSYLTDAFNELNENGILEFKKPMGNNFIDYAW